MRKIFIDCGAHKATSVKMFLELFDKSEEYEIYSFEANPSFSEYFIKYPNVKFENKAVWIYDGKIKFYLGGDASSSIIKEKKTGGLDRNNPIEVPCFDLSQWIINNFSKDDYIVLKMDIEGAEYEVLNKMFKDGSIEYIDKFFGELHYPKIPISYEEHKNTIDKLCEYELNPISWDAENNILGDPIRVNYKDRIPKLDPSYVSGGEGKVKKYTKAHNERSEKYPFYSYGEYKSQNQSLDKKGYYVYENFISEDTLSEIRKDAIYQMDSKKNNKDTELFCSVKSPLMNCRSVFNLATNTKIVNSVSSFFGCIPSIGGCNLRRSYIHSKEEAETQLFHCDPNSSHFVKVFFYLNDVDIDGGPFCYVKGSHRDKFNNWMSKYRWTPSEIERKYGSGRIKYFQASVGDMIMANTTGFHRGKKPKNKERIMLTINYVIHPEFWKEPDPSSYYNAKFANNIEDWKKPLLDYLKPV